MHTWVVVVATLLSLDVKPLAVDLLRQRGNFEDIEVAAFVVQHENGALDLVHWPRGDYRKAHWEGLMPDHVVAVMHTHPWQVPRPSAQDAAEAHRLQLPFYVVSRPRLCVVDADGTISCGKLEEPR
jgi:proteasome lid subunit RPN8/RPN11